MKPWIKKSLIVVAIIAIIGLIAFLRIWYMPARNVQDEKGLEVTAQQIFSAYSGNEKAANTTYLNKAIQVSGEVIDTKTNQAGKTVCVLKTDDPFFGVACTFKENTKLTVNQKVVLKGLCTGYLTGADVVMIDCLLISPDK